MRIPWLRCGLLLAVLGLVGCRGKVVPTAHVDEAETHLGSSIDIRLSEWLELPRTRLAEMAKELSARLKLNQTMARANPESIALLPRLRAPNSLPVLQQADYSAKLGFSVPPYWKEGQPDSVLALHLALHGDVEAARKLADPADTALLQKIEAAQAGRNYPVEWTRLVAMTLLEAQWKVARGEPEGATELVCLHKQLRDLLDPRAAAGPLGGDLLPLGARALREAAVEWREKGVRKTVLAAEIEAALQGWGLVPAPQLPLRPGAGRDTVAGFFPRMVPSPILAASRAELPRLLDLLNLPVCEEGVQGVLAFLDGKDQLVELHLVYWDKVPTLYLEPAQLAHRLLEQGFPVKNIDKVGGLSKQTFDVGDLVFEFTSTPRSNAFGALLRVAGAKAAAVAGSLPANPRDFGSIHLDRTAEQTRWEYVPDQLPGQPLSITSKAALAGLKFPIKDPLPSVLILQPEGSYDLLSSLTIRWTAEDIGPAVYDKLVLPLWASLGPSQIEHVDGQGSSHLALTWQGDKIRFTLRLPYGHEGSEFLAQDLRGVKEIEERFRLARALDDKERAARWQSGKLLQRLARAAPAVPLLQLGMSHKEVQSTLAALSWRTLKTAEGFMVLFIGAPEPRVTHQPRQLFLRFGADNRLAEIRVCYQEGVNPVTPGYPVLLDALKKSGGNPAPEAPRWASLWSDLPAKATPPISYIWSDDRTRLSYQHDSGGSEVILRDCTQVQPEGVMLTRLEFCSRGVEGCRLGDKRADVLKRFNAEKNPTVAEDGAVILFQAEQTGYDVLFVYFEKDVATRVVAHHRQRLEAAPTARRGILESAWAKDIDHLGILRRTDQDVAGNPVCYGFHDDRTRVRLFVQETREGPGLFTEWREWPVSAPAAKTTATAVKADN